MLPVWLVWCIQNVTSMAGMLNQNVASIAYMVSKSYQYNLYGILKWPVYYIKTM